MASFTTGPGMVTPNVVGSTYTAATPQEQARMWELEDRKKAEQEKRNAQILADRAARQQAQKEAEDREKVHAAFNQTYGPQLQRAYQSNAVMSAPSNSLAGRARDFAIGHGATMGGTIGQPGTDIVGAAVGKLGGNAALTQGALQNTLDWMWRQKTDPYLRAANEMNPMRMFYGTQLMPSSGRSEGGGGGMLTPGAYGTMKSS